MVVPPPNMGSVTSSGTTGGKWTIQPQEFTKYNEIFNGLGPTNGLLSGDKVKPVLLNSKLPVDVLGRVWDLSDIDKDGFLDRDEFSVAMHLVYKALEKEPVPMALPPELMPASKRGAKPEGATGGIMVLPPDIMAPKSSIPDPEVMSPPPFTADFSASMVPVHQPIGPAWVVTPMDKQKYDEMFKVADTDMDGYVNGQEIKNIFLNSGVSQTVLAHIWNLCDTQGIGKLNADQFAIAMYLIQEKLKGTDPPPQLTPEMMPPSLRPAAGNVDEVSGMVTDFDTSGMKELDAISKDIEEIKREKILLEQDKAQKEADIRIRNGELQALQKELDTIFSTVKQLETQKGEAQKRLDELDDKKKRVENIAQEMQEKAGEEQKKVDTLRSQIMSSELSAKNREDELRKMRDELNSLRQEEVDLEQKVDAGKTQLDALGTSLEETSVELAKTKQRVGKLQDTQNKINQCINQYNSLLTGDTDVTEPDISFLNEPEEQEMPDVSRSAFTPKSTLSGVKSDPFKSNDPFKDDPFKKNAPDPFQGADPFAPKSSVDGSSKPSKFDDAFGFSAANDPFGGSDPFGATFPSAGKSKAASNDPFTAAFGGASAKDLKSPLNPDDPFGTGSFTAPKSTSKNSLNIHFPAKRDKSPAPSLPPKQKKAPPPPRPPAMKSGGTPSPALQKKDVGGDLFGGNDPFAPSSNASSRSQSTDLFANFDAFGSSAPKVSSGTLSEADQLAWATKSSQEDWERRRKLQEQEQADLELAIKLSQQS